MTDSPRAGFGIDQVLLGASVPESPTDRRLVSAAFRAVIDRLGEQAPIMLAIDDLHWLDPSSTQVLAFAARRLSGRIGLVAAVRADTDGAAASWVQLSAGSVTRIRLGPLAVGQLHAVYPTARPFVPAADDGANLRGQRRESPLCN